MVAATWLLAQQPTVGQVVGDAVRPPRPRSTVRATGTPSHITVHVPMVPEMPKAPPRRLAILRLIA